MAVYGSKTRQRGLNIYLSHVCRIMLMNIKNLKLKKIATEEDTIIYEVIERLRKPQKKISSKFFYDDTGSALFDEICGLDEYYLTRTEIEIMNDNIKNICSVLGQNCLLIELGSGSSIKIRLLLDNLETLAAYVPVDISEDHLLKSVDILVTDYKDLRIIPICTDYTKPFSLPKFDFQYAKLVVYYPGSTLGNFTPDYAKKFLNSIAKRSGSGSGLLIGIDLKKDTDILENAYNDKMGVTAKFNLNILARLNKDIGSDFELDKWEHLAFYNSEEGRIEMHLVSKTSQIVHIDGTGISIEKNETILTEYSYKYSLDDFRSLVDDSYKIEKVWTDKESNFSLQYLSVL